MASAVFVMGVSGSGKSSLAERLAYASGAVFLEGDSFHPRSNVAAMAAGRPLDDAMRAPWLTALGSEVAARRDAGRDVVATCSALRRIYRDRLRALAPHCRFLYLDVPRPVLAARLGARKGHYMPASLLESQLGALEPPGQDEPDCRRLDGTLSFDALLALAAAEFPF